MKSDQIIVVHTYIHTRKKEECIAHRLRRGEGDVRTRPSDMTTRHTRHTRIRRVKCTVTDRYEEKEEEEEKERIYIIYIYKYL